MTKKLFTKAIALFAIVMMLVMTAVPLASAASNPQLDETQKVSLSFKCDKVGYTFELFKVANLESNSTSPYETKYNALVPELSDALNAGDSTSALAVLDGMETMPVGAVSCGQWTTTATSVTKTVSALEQGTYYIRAIGYPAGVKSITNSIVSLPYYTSSQGWVYSYPEINLATKVSDDTPTTKKEITNSTVGNVNFTDVSLGDTIEFKLTNSTAGSASQKLTTYAVYDDMSKGLTLNKNSFSVYLADKNGTKLSELSTTDYALNVTKEAAGENTTFNVALTEDYLAEDIFYQSNATSLIVTYSATLNKYAVVGTTGNPNEDVKLEYGNKSTVSYVNGNTVYVYTFGVQVLKQDEKNEALEGAKFSVFKTEADAKQLANPLGSGVSADDGIVVFKNSNDEVITLANGTYYIVETEAPTGYNVYGEIIPIDIDVTYGTAFTNNTWVSNAPENGIASVTVVNTRKGVINTGGYAGYLSLIGAVFIISALAVFYFSSRKCKADK